MNELLKLFEDKNNHKLFLSLTALFLVLLGAFVAKYYPLVGIVIIIIAYFLLRFVNAVMREVQLENEMSVLKKYLPEQWVMSINDNVATIIKTDKTLIKVAKDYSPQGESADIIWMDGINGANLAFKLISIKKNKPSMIKDTFNFLFNKGARKGNAVEFKGNAQELMQYIQYSHIKK